MERLIRLLALLVLASPLVTAGMTGRESTGPGVDPTGVALSLPVVSHQPSGPVNVTVSSLYRGHTAAYWAGRFRHRTRQLQAARGRRQRLQRVLAQRLLQPAYGTSTLENAFLCIHRYEGSWTDSGSPFWGGLQMDAGFQHTYGDWAVAAFGTADRWPVSVQIATAIRAYVSGRGFRPWPNTARYCGLI